MLGYVQIYFEYYDFNEHPKYDIEPEDEPEQEIDGDMRYQIYLIFNNVILVIRIKKEVDIVYIKDAPYERESQRYRKYQE